MKATAPRHDGARDATALLAEHRRVHARLRALATRRLNSGTSEEAAVYLQAAAHHAWLNHPGSFADSELEDSVGRLARRLFGGGGALAEANPRPRSVLHVLTRAGLFGHTQICRRWIQADRDRQHSVVLTAEAENPVPTPVIEAVAAVGGDIHELSDVPDGLLGRARALRELAAGHEAVVLHVHPYDVVAAIAFAVRGPVPVLFLNHADHVFWLGARSADIFLHFRKAGATLAAARRDVGPEQSAILPTPLADARASVGARELVRRELGVAPEEIMLATAASPYKYESSGHSGFLATVVPILRDLPHAKLVAAGPGNEASWARARADTGGRVLALGVRGDVPALLEASDVYLDSWPLTSVTSLLEAGLAGLPLLRLVSGQGGMHLFEPGVPSLDGHVIEACDEQELRDELSRMIDDSGARRALGVRTRQAVIAHHVGEGWRRHVVDAYARAAAAACASRRVSSPPRTQAIEPLDLALTELHHVGADSHAAFLQLLPSHCRLLPRRLAARMWLAFVVALRGEIRRIGPSRLVRAVGRAWARRRPATAPVPGT